MSTEPLKLAVVGHTNVGKTSLLRTLSRDPGFGEVSSRPSTTRDVLGCRLLLEGEPVVDLFDTPGLEEPIALLELLEAIAEQAQREEKLRIDGPERLRRFLHSEAASKRFQQEAKVLAQLAESDAGLVVIDLRDPVLAKHRDELQLLASVGRPLLPVLNFVAAEPNHRPQWIDVLRRAGLHAQVQFDSVAPEADAERRLYSALATLLDKGQPALQRLVESRQQQAELRRRQAARQAAAVLLKVAARRQATPPGAVEERQALTELTDWVRGREAGLVQGLLALFQFEAAACNAQQLPLIDGRFEADLFAAEALKQLGSRLGSGAASGAAVGVGVDLMTAGISLGAAAGIGAVLGAGLQAGRHYGRRALGRLRGRLELTVDDRVLRHLAGRSLALIRALEGRGHGAVQPIEAPLLQAEKLWAKGLPAELRAARAHPEWAELDDEQLAEDADFERRQRQLAVELLNA
ncbi:GTPase/DUF3482 domain-containing protein [Pseudomarimonas arenosa]|nr:GTPase/DUF3482 domain-containing protein [Pseudomarimonas arenosa]